MNKQLNKYGTDLDSIRAKLVSEEATSFMHNYAKKHGHIYAYCPSEKFFVENAGNGQSTADVYVRIPLSPFELSFLPNYIAKIKKWLTLSWKASSGLKGFFRWLWTLKSLLYFYNEYWVFVVYSFEAYKWNMVNAIVEWHLGGAANAQKLILLNYSKYTEICAEIASVIDDNYIRMDLAQNYERINSFLWVKKNDPTCFVVDEKSKKFDLPDGWSDKEILNHVSRWFYWVTGERVSIKNLKEKV